jgi:hypothetical protein
LKVEEGLHLFAFFPLSSWLSIHYSLCLADLTENPPWSIRREQSSPRFALFCS